MTTAKPVLLALALGAIALAAPAGPAAAQQTSDTAEKLFLEGRVLADRGELEAACLRFEASHNLEPVAVGPTLNLALCKEQLGKYASAATFFRDVVRRSRDSRQDRVELAEQHLKSLEPKISSLRVEVLAPRPEGLEVRVDDQVLPETAWGTELPTDGGPHVVRAVAPHKQSVTLKVTLQREHGRLTVQVPPLDDVRETKTVGYTVGGIGLAVLVAGGILGGTVAARCGGFFRSTCETANGLPDAERRSTLRSLDAQAWVSNVTIGVGLAAVLLGTYLVLTSPSVVREGSVAGR